MTFNLWKDFELPGVPQVGDDVTIHDSVPLTLPVEKVSWSLGNPTVAHIKLAALKKTVDHSSSIMRGVGWEIAE